MFLKALPLLFSALLALPLLANATDRSERGRCTPGDDPNYNWQYTFNGQRYTLTCAFLSNPTNPEQQAKRINNWCPQTVDGINIKDKCRAACNNPCPVEPTGAPSEEPTRTCVPKRSRWSDINNRPCIFYDRNPNKCGAYAESKKRPNSISANVNCCACGGGKPGTPADCVQRRPQWVDSYGDACDWYAEDPANRCGPPAEEFANNGMNANRNCCACGGGKRPNGDDYYNEDEDEVVGTLESGIIMEKKEAAY